VRGGLHVGGPDGDHALQQLSELIAERAVQSDANVKLLDRGVQDVLKGTGYQWHPNVAEDQRMAGILVAALKANLGW